MKDAIVAGFALHGWRKDRLVDAFSKIFETAVAPKQASIWLSFDKECDRWWLANGDFTSAGENVLAGTYAIFPVGMSQASIEQTVAALVGEMERKIAKAYSVRLLGYSAENVSKTSELGDL
ncbi:hypothetical protein [Paraburkholderia largidicola]|uniref:Uncharacterized protein n=1 Tax=Paraburkholderia largidicola TaxID=3014751 RepID=A0A7I8C2Z3_9BURK|nr:hypothetical protein [Paraburkholderia sp. PGU16]BCF95213.1 hypothetical protein PPGU16_82800 [Paraburkholderia sp. PGU16]